MCKYVLQSLINKINKTNKTNLKKNVSTNAHCRTMRFLNIFCRRRQTYRPIFEILLMLIIIMI